MTFPRFLDCSYTLLFDEHQRLGHDLLSTQEKLSGWAHAAPPTEGRKQETVAAQNTQAIHQLQAMMAGVKKT